MLPHAPSPAPRATVTVCKVPIADVKNDISIVSKIIACKLAQLSVLLLPIIFVG